jgi:anaerobic ribonucleoside-triphosphate reductase
MESGKDCLPNRVRKRDGREERLDQVRLTDSIRRALDSVNADTSYASTFSDEVAGSILCDGTVETAGLAASVETVLASAGRSDAADAYRNYRQQCLEHFHNARPSFGKQSRLAGRSPRGTPGSWYSLTPPDRPPRCRIGR